MSVVPAVLTTVRVVVEANVTVLDVKGVSRSVLDVVENTLTSAAVGVCDVAVGTASVVGV